MKDKKSIPADQGLQRHSTGVNEKYDTPVFETLAILDETGRDADTNVAVPSEDAIEQAKGWVDENRL